MPGLKFTADSVVCFVYVNYFRFIRSAPSGRADAARLASGRVIVLGPREAESKRSGAESAGCSYLLRLEKSFFDEYFILERTREALMGGLKVGRRKMDVTVGLFL